jgi:hypothetical protein
MILMSLLDSINTKIDEGAKIELHRFLVTTLTDTSFEEQDLGAAVNAIDKCATIANVDNMPCVYIHAYASQLVIPCNNNRSPVIG